MNILVTGATGYIGPFLIKKLKEIGHNVTILVRKKEDFIRLEAQGFKCILGDITAVSYTHLTLPTICSV